MKLPPQFPKKRLMLSLASSRRLLEPRARLTRSAKAAMMQHRPRRLTTEMTKQHQAKANARKTRREGGERQQHQANLWPTTSNNKGKHEQKQHTRNNGLWFEDGETIPNYTVEEVFEVKVKSVRTLNCLGKLKKKGKSIGREKNFKKAYVYLKEGSSIDFVEGIWFLGDMLNACRDLLFIKKRPFL